MARQSEVICDAPCVGVLRDLTSERYYFALPLVIETIREMHARHPDESLPQDFATLLVRELRAYVDGAEQRAA